MSFVLRNFLAVFVSSICTWNVSFSCVLLNFGTFSAVSPHCRAPPVRKLWEFSFGCPHGTDRIHPFRLHLVPLHLAVTWWPKTLGFCCFASIGHLCAQVITGWFLFSSWAEAASSESKAWPATSCSWGSVWLVFTYFYLGSWEILPPRFMVNIVHGFLVLFSSCSASFYVGIWKYSKINLYCHHLSKISCD